MADEILNMVMRRRKPKGLQRLALVTLAHHADDDGRLTFTDESYAVLARCSGMRGDRFSRIVRELREDGFLTTSPGVIVIPNGGLGEEVHSSSGQTELLDNTDTSSRDEGVEGGEGPDPGGENRSDVDQVLDHYRQVFSPRWKNGRPGEEERREVRAALQIRTVKQCIEAIDGNKASGHHQGENEHHKPYNTLSHIFKGKKGGRTRGEQIDMFIDIFRKAQVTTGTIKSSADPALVATKKEEVRRGFRLKHDEEAVERAEKAETFLEEHGIETKRQTNGYPIWPQTEETD